MLEINIMCFNTTSVIYTSLTTKHAYKTKPIFFSIWRPFLISQNLTGPTEILLVNFLYVIVKTLY